MSDDTRPVLQMSAGDEAMYAEQLLSNPLLETILVEMDHNASLTWRRSTSPEQREEQWHTVIAIAMLRKQLGSRINNAKAAAEKRLRDRRHSS